MIYYNSLCSTQINRLNESSFHLELRKPDASVCFRSCFDSFDWGFVRRGFDVRPNKGQSRSTVQLWAVHVCRFMDRKIACTLDYWILDVLRYFCCVWSSESRCVCWWMKSLTPVWTHWDQCVCVCVCVCVSARFTPYTWRTQQLDPPPPPPPPRSALL